MHNSFRIFVAPLLLIFSGGMNLLVSQNEMTLEELISLAVEENYQIRISRNLEQTAQNRNTIGQAGMLPVVDLNGETRIAINNSQQLFFTGDTQEASNARRRSTSASLNATWLVFDGFAMFARKDQLDQLSALSRADTRFLVEQTVADLSTLYYQLTQQWRLLEAYKQSLEVSQARLAYEERAVEVGASNLLDVRLARVDRNTDSSLVLTQHTRVQELSIAINRIINRDLSLPVVPTDRLMLTSQLDLGQLITSAVNNNGSLTQQHLNELIAISESDISRGGFFPQVELYGNFGFDRQANEVGFLQSSRTFGPEYGLRVRFNLFSGRQTQIANQNADILVENEQLRLQDLELEVEESLRTAYVRWQNRLEQVALEERSVEEASEALKIARQQYELGAITNVDFRVIQLNQINARSRFLSAQLEARLREIDLLRLSGQLLQGM